MERLIKFLQTQPDFRFEMEDDVTFTLVSEDKVQLSTPKGNIVSDDLYVLRDWSEKEDHFFEFRLCNKCGKPIRELFTDCNDFYCCEEHFETYMNEMYGIGSWKSNGEDENGFPLEGECGGYYQYLENDTWNDTGIFWTALT